MSNEEDENFEEKYEGDKIILRIIEKSVDLAMKKLNLRMSLLAKLCLFYIRLFLHVIQRKFAVV